MLLCVIIVLIQSITRWNRLQQLTYNKNMLSRLDNIILPLSADNASKSRNTFKRIYLIFYNNNINNTDSYIACVT